MWVLCNSICKPDGRFELHLSLVGSPRSYWVNVSFYFIEDFSQSLLVGSVEILTNNMTRHFEVNGIEFLMYDFNLANALGNSIEHRKMGKDLHINKVIFGLQGCDNRV